jgi:hypothetical protein
MTFLKKLTDPIQFLAKNALFFRNLLIENIFITKTISKVLVCKGRDTECELKKDDYRTKI